MNKKDCLILFVTILLSVSCNSLSSEILPTQIPTSQIAANPVMVEPSPIDSNLPILSNAQDVYYNALPFSPEINGVSVYYQVPAGLEDIRLFYIKELSQQGWAWVYTDIGQSLVTTFPGPALLIEFKKEDKKLGVASIVFMQDNSTVFAAVDYSGSSLVRDFIAGVSGGLDLMGPYEDDVQVDVMKFSSILVEFKHPSNWLATDSLMQIIDTDDAMIFISDAGVCDINMEICFVNFRNLTGSHFDLPVSIRTLPDLSGLTLEEANILRWKKMKSSSSSQRIFFPEDLTITESLETIEVRNIKLEDGTPAIQRVYKWKQAKVADSIISTYTLFMCRDLLLEFHTDFTSVEWKNEQSIIDQVIAGMKIVP